MLAEGELRCNMDDSETVKDLQDSLADLKAEVSKNQQLYSHPTASMHFATPNTGLR